MLRAARMTLARCFLSIRPASRVLINVRPDALAQVLDREGVIAVAVEYRDERSLDSARRSSHKRTLPSSFPVCKSLKMSPHRLG